jgi:hypothetical protein
VITLLLSVRISIRWGVAYRIRRVTFPAIAGRFVLGSKHLPAPLPGWDRVSDTVLTTLPPIAGRLEAGGPRFRSLYLLSPDKCERAHQALADPASGGTWVSVYSEDAYRPVDLSQDMCDCIAFDRLYLAVEPVRERFIRRGPRDERAQVEIGVGKS